MDVAAPIGVVGTGYVGLVSAVCFAHLGHRVMCMDLDEAKIEGLRQGRVPIYEPGLDKLIDDNAGRLSFTTSYDELLEVSHILFIAVDTPPSVSGDADLSRVQRAVREIAARGGERLIVMKSTVPVGTGEAVMAELDALGADDVTYASNPEFLREGAAIQDFLEPDRVVIGSFRKEDGDVVEALYRGIDTDVVRTSIPTAEMIKYASNAFLATKIIVHQRDRQRVRTGRGGRADRGPRHGARPPHRIAFPAGRHRLRRLLLPQGRPGAQAARRQHGLPLPAAHRRHRGQRAAEAPRGRQAQAAPGRPARQDRRAARAHVQAAHGRSA